MGFQLDEAARPTVLVTVTGMLIEELLVRERHDGVVAVGFELDRDERLTLRRGAPRPGKDQLLVRHHLAINAADIVLVSRRRHANVVAATHPYVCLGFGRGDLRASHP